MESTQTQTALPRTRRRGSPRPILWWVGTFGGAFLGLRAPLRRLGQGDRSAVVRRPDPHRGARLPAPRPRRGPDRAGPGGRRSGSLLLLGVRRKWVLIPATLLVAFFLSLTGRAWWLAAHGQRDAAESCGCFGNLVQRTPAQAFWQDLALLVPALLLAWVGRERRPPLLPAEAHRPVAVTGTAGGAALRLEGARAAAGRPGDAPAPRRRGRQDLRRRRGPAGLPRRAWSPSCGRGRTWW